MSVDDDGEKIPSRLASGDESLHERYPVRFVYGKKDNPHFAESGYSAVLARRDIRRGELVFVDDEPLASIGCMNMSIDNLDRRRGDTRSSSAVCRVTKQRGKKMHNASPLVRDMYEYAAGSPYELARNDDPLSILNSSCALLVAQLLRRFTRDELRAKLVSHCSLPQCRAKQDYQTLAERVRSLLPNKTVRHYSVGDISWLLRIVDNCSFTATHVPSELPIAHMLYYKASRFNHSCSANTYQVFVPSATTFRLYAARDIAEGEQVTVSYGYTSLSNCIASSANVRSRRSAQHFRCRCETCCDFIERRRRDEIKPSSSVTVPSRSNDGHTTTLVELFDEPYQVQASHEPIVAYESFIRQEVGAATIVAQLQALSQRWRPGMSVASASDGGGGDNIESLVVAHVEMATAPSSHCATLTSQSTGERVVHPNASRFYQTLFDNPAIGVEQALAYLRQYTSEHRRYTGDHRRHASVMLNYVNRWSRRLVNVPVAYLNFRVSFYAYCLSAIDAGGSVTAENFEQIGAETFAFFIVLAQLCYEETGRNRQVFRETFYYYVLRTMCMSCVASNVLLGVTNLLLLEDLEKEYPEGAQTIDARWFAECLDKICDFEHTVFSATAKVYVSDSGDDDDDDDQQEK